MKEGRKNLEKIEVTLENMSHVLLQQCTGCGDLVIVDCTSRVICSNRAIKCKQNDI